MSGRGAALMTAILAGDCDGVVRALSGATGAERAELAGPLSRYERHLWSAEEPLDAADREVFGLSHDPADRLRWGRTYHDWMRPQRPALLVAGAGCLPDTAGVATWLLNQAVGVIDPPGASIIAVLAERGRPTPAAVGRRMAARLRDRHLAGFQWPITAVLVEAGDEVPTDDGFVLGWLACHGARTRRETEHRMMVDRLRDDPFLPHLLPRVMAVEQAGAVLSEQWVHALGLLAAAGRVDRAALLDGCLYRLRAGDRVGALRQVLALYRELAPTDEERAGHLPRYLDLMSAPQGFVAAAALAELRALDTAGRLPLDTALEAARVGLGRTEKKILTDLLTWLNRLADRAGAPDARAGGADAVLATLAVALGQERGDVAERALRMLARRWPSAGEDGRRAVAAEAAALTGDLRRQAEELLGLPAGDGPPPVDPVPVAPLAEPIAPPIASLAEFTAEFTAVAQGAWWDGPALERVLAAIVRWSAADRTALAATAAPMLAGDSSHPLSEVLRAAAGLPGRPRRTFYDRDRFGGAETPPDRMLHGRLMELIALFRQGRGPAALLATPARTSGHVDPERVLAVLAEAQRDGWFPGPMDQAQALLRLPRRVDPAVRERAAGLVTVEARRFVRFLGEGGLPDPVPTALRMPAGTLRDRYVPGARVPEYRLVTAFAAPPPGGALDEVGVPPGLLGLSEAARPVYERAFGRPYLSAGFQAWPGVLPSHREITAAHVLPFLAASADQDLRGHGTDVLPGLAAADGPFGPATALAVGYVLCARHGQDRMLAVDALLTLDGRGAFDGALTGRLLGPPLADGTLVPRRLAEALAEVTRAGAHRAVWRLTAAAMPALLAVEGPARPGTADLIALAASSAAVSGDFTGGAASEPAEPTLVAPLAGPLEELANGGTGRMRTEARRLRRVLSGG